VVAFIGGAGSGALNMISIYSNKPSNHPPHPVNETKL
jgi:hypothetical protein